MRIYDPEEDLPPKDTPVYALFVAGELCRNEYCDIVTWNPKSGWDSKIFRVSEVLLWCDFSPPDLKMEFEMRRLKASISASPHSDQDATEQD